MSSSIRKLFAAFTRNKHLKILLSNLRRSKPSFYPIIIGAATALTAGYFGTGNHYLLPTVSAKKEKTKPQMKLTSSEKRFIKFASLEYDGQLYMTPEDFLDSMIYTEPRPRIQRKHIRDNEMDFIKSNTPTVEKGSSKLFRDIHHHGIISYVEYLFLLSMLCKHRSQFKIAFNAFDRDENGVVDLDEYCIIERIFTETWRERQERQSGENDIDDSEAIHREHDVQTTLKLHFFGQDGKSVLSFESFSKFIRDLQKELLETEFFEFARGFDVITEVEFLKIILRYSFIDKSDHDEYLDSVMKIKELKGITFNDFKNFCDFLNHLEDFKYAITLYTPIKEGVSKDGFERAVKVSTGIHMSDHLIDTIFAIFGKDDLLDFEDFMDIAKDRQKRVFQTRTKSEGWEGFKACVRNEMMKTKGSNKQKKQEDQDS
ncbi:unnamed protein product [Callosobruchus maculatus]|uniref:EF-hand domain-containing protein n=1 Tax=Callosobruchus maculatus TaxID=64391 RepID=A0A653DHS3_CALMS|nr:unnamed protein product [Callosobruchus maculatus]